MLYDFMLLLEKGAFYLAGERMKAPQFFNSIRGKSEVFNEGCRRMGEVLSNRSCKSGEEGWKAVWEKVLWGRVSDEKIKKMIVEMGGAFFEKNAAAMEQRLKECALDIHKQIDFYRKDYVEKMKVICPVGILGGIMISIAALGIVITVLGQVLKHSGREEMTFLLSLAGLVIVLFWIVPYISELFKAMQDMFSL